MRRMILWSIGLGGTLFALRVFSFVTPEFGCLLFSGIIFVALVVFLVFSLVAGFTKWRLKSGLWLVPSIIGIASLCCSYYIASPVARLVSDKVFEWQLDDYSRVVSNFRDGSLFCASSCEGNVQTIETTSRPKHVRDIWGTHCDDKGVIVLFRVQTDVPLLHEGYLFKDYGENSNCSRLYGSRQFTWSHLPYVRRITANWYRFSDQPGF